MTDPSVDVASGAGDRGGRRRSFVAGSDEAGEVDDLASGSKQRVRAVRLTLGYETEGRGEVNKRTVAEAAVPCRRIRAGRRELRTRGAVEWSDLLRRSPHPGAVADRGEGRREARDGPHDRDPGSGHPQRRVGSVPPAPSHFPGEMAERPRNADGYLTDRRHTDRRHTDRRLTDRYHIDRYHTVGLRKNPFAGDDDAECQSGALRVARAAKRGTAAARNQGRSYR